MRNQTIRCVFMDMGKVLVDIDLNRLKQKVAGLKGPAATEPESTAALNRLVVQYESGQVESEEFFRRFCDLLDCAMYWDDFLEIWNSIFLPVPILGDGLLKRLAAQADLWILSNTNPLHYEYIRAHYSFLDFFKGAVLSHEVGAMKPDEKIFRSALQLAGADAARSLFIDDQEANVAAAETLGIQSCRFTGPRELESCLKNLGLI